MKKLLLLSALLIFACSNGDDSDSSNSNGNSINPPAWIQGVWTNDSIYAFEFRADDMCVTAGSTNCYKALMALSNESSAYEEISDTRYYVVISYGFSEERLFQVEIIDRLDK